VAPLVIVLVLEVVDLPPAKLFQATQELSQKAGIPFSHAKFLVIGIEVFE